MDPNIDQIAPQYADPEAVDTPRTNNRKVAYFYDHDVGNFNYGLGHVMKPHRMRMTHNLLINYGLLQHMDVFRPTRATHEQLTRFHTDEYIDFLERVTPETVEELTASGSRFIVGEDCPAFEGLYEFCTISAGGSIGGAQRLNSGAAETCINWAGGLHHAKKREASGFCYVNDIVLAILELLRYHPRVLYIDIDVHHGDGVEEAFYSTDRVMTCSFHQFGDFFPGTGDVRDIGLARGKNYAVNIPLRGGITDEAYQSIFEPVIQHIMEWYRPGAVILQCGADSLAGDKLGGFNLSMKGHANCVKFLSTFGVPLMLVGGGGYTTKNVARTWTYETGVILGKELDENLPFNDYLEYYGPRYKLEVLDNNMENQNSREYLDNIKSRVIDTLRNMPFAPSSGMHEVPRMSVGKAIGIVGEDDGDSGDESDIDGQINQRLRQIHEANREMERAGEYESDADSSRIDMDEDDFDRAGSSARNRTNNVSGSSRRAHDLSRTSSSTSSSAHNGSSNHHHDHHHVSNNGGSGSSYPYQQGHLSHQSHQQPSSHSYTHSHSANLPSSHSIYPPSSTLSSSRQNGGKSLYYLPSTKGDRAAMGLPTYDLTGAGVGSYNGGGPSGHSGGMGAGIGHPLGSVPGGGSTFSGAGPSTGSGHPGHQRKRSFFSTSGVLPGATGYLGLNGGTGSTGGESGGGSVGGSSDQVSGRAAGVPAGGWGY